MYFMLSHHLVDSAAYIAGPNLYLLHLLNQNLGAFITYLSTIDCMQYVYHHKSCVIVHDLNVELNILYLERASFVSKKEVASSFQL